MTINQIKQLNNFTNPKNYFLFGICLTVTLCFCNWSFALTLDESIAVALKNNPQLKATKEKARAALARKGQALSTIIPHVSLDASAGKNYQEPARISFSGTTFSTVPDEVADASAYSISLKQMIFNGVAFSGLKIANSSYAVALEEARKAEIDLVFSVQSSYFEVLKAKKMLEVARNGISTMEKHLRQVQIFYNSGITTKSDVLRAETELANMKQMEIQSRGGYELARMMLGSLLVKEISPEAVIEENQNNSAQEVDYKSLLAAAYKSRPDWKSFQASKKIAEDTIALYTSGYLPSVLYVQSAGRSLSQYPSSGTKYDLGNWRMMLMGSWNIFDGFETPNRVLEASANLESLKALEQSVKDGIELEVKSAYLNLEISKEKIEAARIADDLGRKAFRLAGYNYVSNIGSNLAVLDASSAWLKTQTNLLCARYDLELAYAKINKVSGTKIF